jgi:hypothetical protein
MSTYYERQLVRNEARAPTEPLDKALLGLAIWTVVLFGLALRASRLEQRRKFT